MKSRTIELPIDIDPVVVGANSGLLWAGDDIVLAGIGEAAQLPVERPAGAIGAQAALTELEENSGIESRGRGLIGFGSFPFDQQEPTQLVIPRMVVGSDSSGERWLTVVGSTDEDAIGEVRDLATGPSQSGENQPPRVTPMVAPEHWRDEVVAVARDRIRSGELRKAVLARELEVIHTDEISVAAVVLGLRERFPETNLFSFDGFVGASPELLVGRDRSTVRAHPLAGTMPKRNDPEADLEAIAELLRSTKDQWEHRITIDWLLDTLLPFCSYVDAEPEPTVVSLANVHHLGTQVHGVLSTPSASILELVAALHPTPAVGGDPQDTALGLIAQIEPGDRERYAGAVGWVDTAGNGSFAVAIRSAQITGSTARVWAGVGVVADSDPATELTETEAKFEAMLSVLADSD